MFQDILYLPKVKFMQEVISEQNSEQYNVILVLMTGFEKNNFEYIPYAEILFKRLQLNKDSKDKIVLKMVLPNSSGTEIVLCRINHQKDNFLSATELRKALQKCGKLHGDVGIINAQDNILAFKEAVRSIYAHSLKMPKLKSKPQENKKINNIVCVTEQIDLNEIKVASQGNAIARYLSALPKNYLTPKIYIKQLKKFAQEQKWGFSFYSKKKLTALQAGAFLAVARASNDAGIVHLSYKPAEDIKTNKKLSLVGKGVCYDTGGINVKPSQYMFGMQEDMQGSSVALGVFYMLSQLTVPYEIDCWLAITENNIDAGCYTPNEVITASNGTTIEVVHTDAEGRMILADTLVLASKKKPDVMIDYATLTGASIGAIGKKYSSVFTNEYDWNTKLIEAGISSGERVWPFPMSEDYDENIKSDIADVKQCCLKSGPDHIDAARFLSKFVGESIKWVHVDLAAAMDNKDGLGAVPSSSTGFGVWFSQEFIKQVM